MCLRLHSPHPRYLVEVPVIGVNLRVTSVEHLSGDEGVREVYAMLNVEVNGVLNQGFAGHPGASQRDHVIGETSNTLARPAVEALEGPDDIAERHFRQIDLLLTGLEASEESLAVLCLLGRFI